MMTNCQKALTVKASARNFSKPDWITPCNIMTDTDDHWTAVLVGLKMAVDDYMPTY
jgi:hypothetical protein